MRTRLQGISGVARLRVLLALALVLGMLVLQVERSTLAVPGFFVDVPDNVFTAGVVDLNCQVTPASSTCSSLPTNVAFTWSSTGAGSADCASVFAGLDVRSQAMAPGHFCVGKVTIANDHPSSLDAWLRVRLVRRTVTGDAQLEALNDRLRFYMSEYSAGTSRTAAAYQAADCTAASFRPASVKSSATIPDVTDSASGSRKALTALTAAGFNVGAHPGVSSPPDATVVALQGLGMDLTTGTNGAPVNPVPPTPTAVPTSAATSTPGPSPTATSTPVFTPTPSPTPTPVPAGGLGNMNTSAVGRNAYNIIGNDEVRNPRRLSDVSQAAGTRSGGTNAEAALAMRMVRHYCAAVFFPSDTGVSIANGAGDNAAGTESVTYHLVVDATQQANNAIQ